MADGNVAATVSDFAQIEAAKSRWIAGFFTWLFAERSGRLSIWAACAFLGLVAVLVWHVFATPVLELPEAKALFIAASSLLILPLLLLCLDSSDNLARGPGLALPVLSLMVLGALTVFVVSDREFGLGILSSDAPEARTLNLAARFAVFCFFIAAFVPRIWNASNFARYEAQRRHDVADRAAKENHLRAAEEDNAEAMSALVATLGVTLIGLLAVLAGNGGSSLSFRNSFGLLLCGSVISVFAVVVFMESIAEWALVTWLSRVFRAFSRRMRWLAKFYNWIDTGLVRIGADVVGMGHRRAASRYSLLSGTLLCLCLMGWFLPVPLGVIPVFVAFILSISVSRLWGWVEDDRSLAAMTEYRINAPYRIGFREDYRDETLLGFIFVFTLIPIAMMQAHNGQLFGPELFKNADHKSFLDWFGFFGVELAKAVPIVDWAEIYGVTPDTSMITMNGTASKHAVFLARVMVDLVLIAALLQAVGISNRNRQQKSLYRAGQLARLDQFVERTELSRAIRATRRETTGPLSRDLSPEEAAQRFDLSKLRTEMLVDFRRYDQDRLRLLFDLTGDINVQAFLKAIAFESGMTFSTAINLTRQIAESSRNEFELFRAYERAIRDHDAGRSTIEASDIYLILAELRSTAGLRDFKKQLMDKMVELGRPDQIIDDLVDLAGGPKSDHFKYARDHAAKLIARTVASANMPENLVHVKRRMESMANAEKAPGDALRQIVISAIARRLQQLRERATNHDQPDGATV